MRLAIKLLLGAFALILTSCIPTKEEKAENFVRETLKKFLYYPDSYEPISTSVDSMFIDANVIDPILQISDEINDIIFLIKSCERKIESAESLMDIWSSSSVPSKYFRGEYERAKSEKEKSKHSLDKNSKKLSELLSSLKENVAKYNKKEFTGWVVNHRFRCLNGTGEISIPGEMIFFCDKEFKNYRAYEADKLEVFGEILKMVNEATSDEDIIDYFNENRFFRYKLQY